MTDTSVSQSRRGESSRYDRVTIALSILLAGYWLSMFVGTHIPRVPQVLAEQGDKTLHLCAYGGLGVLLLSWRISVAPATLRMIVIAWFVIAGYGIFDEITQPFFGRFCDAGDWIADMIGTTIAFALTAPVASYVFRCRRS